MTPFTSVSSTLPGHEALALTHRHVSVLLPVGRALTLHVRRPGTLQVSSGRLWLTLALAADDPSERGGDHFLHPGQSLALAPAQGVIIESFAPGQPMSAHFCWVPAPASMFQRQRQRLADFAASPAGGRRGWGLMPTARNFYWP